MDRGSENYRRFLDGDDTGLVELVRDYKDGLILYLNSLVNDIHLAEDLTEDTFVRLGTRKPKNRGKSSFKTWLYTIGRNIAIDHLRRESRIIKVPFGGHEELPGALEDIEAQYIRSETRIAVHGMLRRLKPQYRQVLWLTYFEGFSNKEAAAVMKKSVNNIETLLHRARRSLRAEMEKGGISGEELP